MPLRVVEGASKFIEGASLYKTFTTALAHIKVDGPLGRRFLRGLSLTRLWREGCGGRL